MKEGFIHQTMGTTETEGEMDLDYTIGAPKERNIRYVVLPREPKEKLPRRSTTDLRKPAEKQ